MQYDQDVQSDRKEGDVTMERVMSVTGARSRFSAIVNKVQYQGDTVVLVKNGKPAAALISFALFEQFLKYREAAFRVVTEVQEQNNDLDMSEEEVMAVVNEAVHEVRAQAKKSHK